MHVYRSEHERLSLFFSFRKCSRRKESTYGREGVTCLTKAASQKRYKINENQNHINYICFVHP